MSLSRTFLLAIDIGTSSLKSVVYDGEGVCLAQSAVGYEYRTPHPGWAEADPQDWWQALKQSLAEIRSTLGTLSHLEMIALTGQMHTCVLLDAQGQVIEPTILWLDRRAAAETLELQQQFNLPPYHLNSTYTLPKLLWLKRHRPEVIDRVRHILWAKDYLRYRLTGSILTDRTEAGGAALLDWETLDWAGERLAWCGIDQSVLPPLCDAVDDGGNLTAQVADELGLNPRARVLVGAGDVLALITGAPPKTGRVTCSLGTSSMIFGAVPSGWHARDAKDRIYIYPLLPYPLLGGVSSTTGASLQWASQTFFADLSFDEAVHAALQIEPGCDGLLFLPFLSGERSPYWNDALRGAFYGLTLAHERASLLRAVMEGVAFSLRYLLNVFEELGVSVDSLALAGGGTRTAGWPQMICDICNRPLSIYSGQGTVTHALYAYACQALHGQAAFEDALLRTFHQPQLLQPQPQQAQRYQSLFEKYALLADFSHQVLSR